jgi:hypothetical protein
VNEDMTPEEAEKAYEKFGRWVFTECQEFEWNRDLDVCEAFDKAYELGLLELEDGCEP